MTQSLSLYQTVLFMTTNSYEGVWTWS